MLRVPLPRSHIVRYLGMGTSLKDSSFHNEEQARAVARATYLVQEYIDGGSLRDQVLQQASSRPSASPSGTCLTHQSPTSTFVPQLCHLPYNFSYFPSYITKDQISVCSVQPGLRHATGGGMQMTTAHLHKKHYSQDQGLAWLIQIAKGLKYLHTARPVASPCHCELQQ